MLIHLAPELLPTAYAQLYALSQRYILIAEYYNPAPVEVSYRGNSGKLFKRDFAGEMLDRYADLHLLDYGFVYHRDPQFPADDITWFLSGKTPLSNVAIIPARGGSKRIPRKNLAPFDGVPMIVRSIRTALDSGLFDQVVVSTDDEEIAEVARAHGAQVPFLRPARSGR